MTHVHTFAIGLLCIALPSIGAAADLQLSTSSRLSYDSGDNTGGNRASIVLTAPISLRPSTGGRYSGGLSYTPSLQIRPTDSTVVDFGE